MESPTRVLEKPIPYFSRDFSKYTQIFNYSIGGESPFFGEYDCLIVYVRAGSGRVLVNQTPYDLEPGCIGILHSYHVFRFENSSSVPLDIQVLVYPYPEMVLMDFTQQNTGTEDGSACDCSVFSPLDTAGREKVESLLDTFQEELNVQDDTTPLIRNCLFIQLRQIHQKAQRTQTLPNMPLCGQLLVYAAAHSFHNISAASVAEQVSPVNPVPKSGFSPEKP